MKLAEALQERSDINKRISELRRRLENCLLVQEGEEPAEDPMDLLNELDSSTERLETLVASINETNCNTKVDGMSLTELIARKDALTLRHSAYKELVYTAGNNTYRARGTEIKVKAVIKAAELQKTVDSLAKEIRLLDNKLQEINSDYEAKRFHNVTLQPLEIVKAREGLFNDWLKSKGKLGGQHKIPRLSNSRKNLDEMLEMNK